MKQQEQVLNFLLSSLSKEMFKLVAVCPTPHEMWENLVTMSSSQPRVRVINTLWCCLPPRKATSLLLSTLAR
jgi:hypothetical protein